MRKLLLLPVLALLIVAPIPAQPAAGEEDPVSYIGLTLAELIGRFGAPRSVYPVRGLEDWQDDVVFVYDRGDFYVHKDRVWQVGPRIVRGIKIGDTEEAVLDIMASFPEPSRMGSGRNALFYSLPEGSWPMVLRCEFDSEGRVSSIFIYRSDL